jgi:hypothetical protein
MNTSLCGTLLAAGLFLLSAHGKEQDQAEISGFLRGSYDYRGQGSYSDQDAYAYWYLRVSDDTLDIYTSGRLHKDLDGTSNYYVQDPYISASDTSRDDEFRLLQLYADMHNKAQTFALRAGRQYVDIADYIQMDGVQAMVLENKRLGGRVFMGKPVSYYSSTSGDFFGGVSLTGKPWLGNRSRVTYARYEEDSEGTADDHFFFDTRQRIADEFHARSYLSLMNEDVRMAGMDMFYNSMEERVFDVAAGVRHWGSYTADTRAYSPLVQSLGEAQPYTTAYGRFTTQILPWFYLSPGVYMRSQDDSNSTNRRYEKYDLSFIFEPMEGLSSTLSAEYWDVQYDESFFGLSGDIRYRYHKLWEVSAGAAYLDYTYFQFSDFSLTADGGSTVVGEDGTRVEISPESFVYFLKGRWNITKNLAWRVAGEIEDDTDENDLGYRLRTSFEVRL